MREIDKSEILKELKERFRIPQSVFRNSSLKDYEIEFYSEVMKIKKQDLIDAVKIVN